jgi:entry exclusion lipoprotein TrbK
MKSVAQYVSIIIGITWLYAVSGCDDNREVAVRTCAELEKRTDPLAKAELEKRCPRREMTSKPSPKINW